MGMAGCNMFTMFMPDRQHQSDSGTSADLLAAIQTAIRDQAGLSEQAANTVITNINWRIQQLPRPFPGLRLPSNGILPQKTTTRKRRILMQVLPYFIYLTTPGELGHKITCLCVRACMRACVRACMRACVRACMRACVRVCVCVCV